MKSRATQAPTPPPDGRPGRLDQGAGVATHGQLTGRDPHTRPPPHCQTEVSPTRRDRDRDRDYPSEPGHAEQIAADHRWLEEVRRAGFSGKLYENGADLLFAAAVQKVKGRILAGEMMAASAKIGRPVTISEDGLRQLRACPADLEALTWDVVGRAWTRFHRDALVGGGWDPSRGATLAGYLQGACAQEFKNAYQKWLPKFLKRDLILVDPITLSDFLRGAAAPRSSSFRIDDDAQALLDHFELSVQQVVVLAAIGYNKKETAAILGIDPKTVSARLDKAKRILLPEYPDWRP